MKAIDTLKERLHRLKDDQRAVSPVIGFVLIFALIMIVFTLYQTNVVPAANTEVEFEHSQTVEGQMSVLNDKLVETATTGERRSATISTGLQYPSRALAINPGNPVGTLQTVSTSDVTISGTDAEGGTTTCTFEDLSFLRYQPNYNRLDEETTYSIEYGMLVQDYSSSDATNLQSEGVAFPEDADEPIRLTLIEGDVQTSRMTTSVSMEFVHNYTTMRYQSGTTITLPTTLSQSEWSDLLSDKDGLDLQSHSDSGSINTAEIRITSDRTIRVKKVTPGGADDTDRGCSEKLYVENETSRSPDVAVDTDESLSVSVHDQFRNPITSNVTVEAATSGAGSLDTTSKNLNTSGQAPFTYDPAETDSGTPVDVSVRLRNGSENEPIPFELDYPELDIENVTRLSPAVSLDSTTDLTVRALDESGDALGDIDIDATTNGSGNLTPTDTNSDDSGDATFTYEPSDEDNGSTVEVTASLPNGSADDSVTFKLEYPSDEGDSNDGGNFGFGEIDNGYDIGVIISDVASAGGNRGAEITFRNIGSGTATATDVRISGFSIQGQIESGDTIRFAEREIPFNANEVSLEEDSFDVPDDDDDDTVSVNVESIGNQGGFLIIDIRFDRGGQTEVGTYAVSIPG